VQVLGIEPNAPFVEEDELPHAPQVHEGKAVTPTG